MTGPTALGIGTTLILVGAIALWIALVCILGPFVGRLLKDHQPPPIETQGRERVGVEPSPILRHAQDAGARAARGHLHAARSKQRRDAA